MTRVEVLAPGLLTTVQDLGRIGFEAEGVPRGGAADPVSLRAANRLAGNPEGAPALEMTLTGGAYRFDSGSWIAVAGADLQAVVETASGARVPLPPWSARRVATGDVVRLGSTRDGARGYLAVSGGIEVRRVLGSASTHLASGMGGHRGRALRGGDVLVSGASREPTGGVDAGTLRAIVFRKTLRVVEGAQRDWFDPGAGRLLAEGEFLVAEASDRIGTRLDGPWPAPPADRSLWTEGALPGGVQVTPDGVGIVLGADAPTTGGYPKIAAVIAADLPALGQLRPRDRVRFAWVDRPAALREAVDLERRVHAAFGGTMRP